MKWPPEVLERSVLEDLLALVGKYQPEDFFKVEEGSAPDFKHKAKPLWIEITKVTETQGKWKKLNESLRQLSEQLQKRLQQAKPNCGLLIVTLTAKLGHHPSRHQKRLEDLVHLIRNNHQGTSTRYFANCDLPTELAKEFAWISIRHQERSECDIRVLPNTLYTDIEYLPTLIKSAVKRKENKNYRNRVGTDDLWLVVEVSCRLQEIDIKELSDLMSSMFSRVYLIFDYDPEIKSRTYVELMSRSR